LPTPPPSLLHSLLAAASALVGIGSFGASSEAVTPPSAVVTSTLARTASPDQIGFGPTLTIRTAVDLPLSAEPVQAPSTGEAPVPIDVAIIAPTLEPTAGPAATPQRAPRNPQESFIIQVAGGAQQSQRATGVPASVAIAQAVLESAWGRSYLAREANNLFGIKGLTKEGPAGVVWIDAWEVENGQDVNVPQPFRKYNNMGESIVDHGLFFVENRRYRDALSAKNDPREFARRIAAAGYATDP